MIGYLQRTFSFFALLLLYFSCGRTVKTDGQHNPKVCVRHENGRYSLYRNGKPYLIKGASGYTHLKELAQAGGNTIRLWDTTHIAEILDSAQVYHLAVVAGLPMPDNNNMDAFYNNEALVKKHLARLTATVNRYKNHPALLCWCLGNELAFPYKPTYNRFYNALNDVVSMIHHDDPDHPVTTTIMTFQTKNIMNIRLRTDFDFISFNIFGAINTLKKDLKDFEWFWKGPYLITEWAIEGPWNARDRNAWGAYVENSSNKKAEQYLAAYRGYMPVNDPRFLGSMVFYWGQKQECTPTWFSFFGDKGEKTDAYNVMRYIWTGKKPDERAPDIKFMLLDDKGRNDNLLFKPGDKAYATVYLYHDNPKELSYKWEVLPEDWFKTGDAFGTKKPDAISNAVVSSGGGDSVTLIMPPAEGPYRLFVYIYNRQGYVATDNIPFYVLNNP